MQEASPTLLCRNSPIPATFFFPPFFPTAQLQLPSHSLCLDLWRLLSSQVPARLPLSNPPQLIVIFHNHFIHSILLQQLCRRQRKLVACRCRLVWSLPMPKRSQQAQLRQLHRECRQPTCSGVHQWLFWCNTIGWLFG